MHKNENGQWQASKPVANTAPLGSNIQALLEYNRRKTSLVLIDEDEDGNTQTIQTVEVPEGLSTLADFEGWIEGEIFDE